MNLNQYEKDLIKFYRLTDNNIKVGVFRLLCSNKGILDIDKTFYIDNEFKTVIQNSQLTEVEERKLNVKNSSKASNPVYLSNKIRIVQGYIPIINNGILRIHTFRYYEER